MGDIVQQNSHIAAVYIVKPVNAYGVDVPVVLMLETPPVMGGGDEFKHGFHLPEKFKFILYSAEAGCQDAQQQKSLFWTS